MSSVFGFGPAEKAGAVHFMLVESVLVGPKQITASQETSLDGGPGHISRVKIGRASCRERVLFAV